MSFNTRKKILRIGDWWFGDLMIGHWWLVIWRLLIGDLLIWFFEVWWLVIWWLVIGDWWLVIWRLEIGDLWFGYWLVIGDLVIWWLVIGYLVIGRVITFPPPYTYLCNKRGLLIDDDFYQLNELMKQLRMHLLDAQHAINLVYLSLTIPASRRNRND